MAMNLEDEESKETADFRSWFAENGGYIHPSVSFSLNAQGRSVHSKSNLDADSLIVSCPFTLAITADVARTALEILYHEHLLNWSERQLICAYICMHWVLESLPDALRHMPYINTLPKSTQLRTPLYFTDTELGCFKGTNLYGATNDRRKSWQEEWSMCHSVVSRVNEAWGDEFTCDRYITAATYMSSRAFPSTLLSNSPSLAPDPASYPALLPGVDALNHKRGQPVTWKVVDGIATTPSSSLALIIHTPTKEGDELFNNYGPKPNSELILGYGFTIEDNPNDTIRLKLSGFDNTSEIGRDENSKNVYWEEFKILLLGGTEDTTFAERLEQELDCVDRLSEMVEDLLNRLPREVDQDVMRPEVAAMWKNYVQGQRDILTSFLDYLEAKETSIIQEGKAGGVDIIIDDDIDHDTEEL